MAEFKKSGRVAPEDFQVGWREGASERQRSDNPDSRPRALSPALF
jgi:hypothetical protein